MIRRREATVTVLTCDACSATERVYMHGSGENWWFDCPEGWTSYPEERYLVEGAEPRIVLCPDHAHLTATVRLVDSMLKRVASVASLIPVGEELVSDASREELND